MVGLNGDERAHIRCEATDGKMSRGDDVVIAIRPEEVKLSFDTEGDGFNQLPCRVETAVFLGDKYECHLRYGATTFTLPTSRAEPVSAGQRVCLRLSPDSVRIWRKGGPA
ncbi:MAG: TOBE domain-containing protein, partial [Deltaproteobacteria bacterium]|nr:TOBE domain-containing protein [Deltaproteobacteria bacterium]